MNSSDLMEMRHLIDFGLVVLIWLVQSVIYPGFLHLSPEKLLLWHRRYTRRMSYIVGPLALAQTTILLIQVWKDTHWLHSVSLGLLILCLIWTFAVSVRLHNQVQIRPGDSRVLRQLVATNWVRTVLWTAICVLGWLTPGV